METGLTATLAKHIGGWVMARNSLSHNRGVVRDRDAVLAGGSMLLVSWFRFEMLIGDTVIPADSVEGTFVAKDTVISTRGTEGVAEFPIGSVVTLDERSVLEICLTSFFLIDQLNQALAHRLAQVVGNREQRIESSSNLPDPSEHPEGKAPG